MVASAPTPTNSIPDSIQKEYEAYQKLSTDEKLGLLWVVYKNMGGAITPAAPRAANPEFTNSLLTAVKEMEESEQLDLMRGILRKANTEHIETYNSYTTDNKLLFWYQLSEGMEAGEIVGVPESYELSNDGKKLYKDITLLEFNEQITFLRHCVV